jgi:hypothetical protein
VSASASLSASIANCTYSFQCAACADGAGIPVAGPGGSAFKLAPLGLLSAPGSL